MKAIEEEDILTIMSLVSTDYGDGFGMDYEILERRLINLFKRYENIKILIPIKKIRVNQDMAICSLRVSVQARNSHTKELELIYGYSNWGDEFIFDLIKSNGKWLFINAHP